MTGSVALDVVIGLVFIFLLYSLFASIIQEIVANLLGLRARNLRHALTRMLEDDKDEDTHNIVSRAVTDTKQRWKRNMTSANDGLLKEFYKQPIIKYLASGRYFSKPSYIEQSDFSKTLMGILKDKGDQLLRDAGEDDDIALIDKIESALNDEDTSLINVETKKHLKSLLENAQNDLQKFEANLEEWFNNMMDRASGWYKKTTQLNLFIIGFILAIVFNVNTIAITKTLAKDEDARAAMVELASNYVKENETLITDIIKRSEDMKKETVNDTTKAINQDTTKVNSAQKELDTYKTKIDSLLKIQEQLQNDIAGANAILGYMPANKLPVEGIPYAKEKIDSVEKTLNANKMMIGYDKTCNKTDECVVVFASVALAKNTAKYYYIEEHKNDDGSMTRFAKLDYWAFYKDHFSFLGYLLTALAISLGASFWFDILNKLIKLRGSIQSKKAETQKDLTTQVSVPVKQRVG